MLCEEARPTYRLHRAQCKGVGLLLIASLSFLLLLVFPSSSFASTLDSNAATVVTQETTSIDSNTSADGSSESSGISTNESTENTGSEDATDNTGDATVPV